jgi:hypothetical protein
VKSMLVPRASREYSARVKAGRLTRATDSVELPALG